MDELESHVNLGLQLHGPTFNELNCKTKGLAWLSSWGRSRGHWEQRIGHPA